MVRQINERRITMGTKWTPERTAHVSSTTKRNKPVEQWTKDDVFVAEHISGAAAAKAINGNVVTLSNCLNGRMPTYKGFKWRFKQY